MNHPPAAESRTVIPCKAVLFDCDGVLVDSESIIHGSWTRWAAQMGIDPAEVLATVHGRRAQDTVAHFIPAPQRAAALDLIDAIELEDAMAVTAMPGAAALLNEIPAGRWAIFTSGSQALARARLTAAGVPLPRVLITGQDVTHGKPHPEGYLTAAAGLGIPITDCVVVEDSAPGIRAAQAANASSVLAVGQQDVADLHPQLTVPDLSDVRWTPDGLSVPNEAG